MAKYKSLKGQPIQVLTADPPAPVEGQVWVVANPGTASVMRGYALGTGAWASGGDLNTAKNLGVLTGSQTAALYAGGNTPPSTQQTEIYNGTAWTEVNDMTETARDNLQGFGTQTASIAAAGVTGSNGNKSKLVELWDGTSWTAGTDNNTARLAGGSAGKAQTAGIIFGGKDASGPGDTDNADTESWNGTSWTELNNMNTAGAYISGGGTQTSAIVNQGGARTAQNESWNGTSWSEIAEQNTFRDESAGDATDNTAGLLFGGQLPPGGKTVNTELWNGSAWTEVNNLAVARSTGSGGSGGQSGGQKSSLAVGGQTAPGARQVTTEEWTIPLAAVSFDID